MSDTSTEARVQRLMEIAGAFSTASIRNFIATEKYKSELEKATQSLEAALRSELSGKDAERLDYLQQRGATVSIVRRLDADGYRLMFQIGGLHSAVDTNIRQAIDAAIESTTKEQS
ncbi:MAG: hypothetical protein HYX42_00075 [Polaromonas sp.]|uniref:hypothetical protein n=1 Tax=Polaromonas sp. TaxID=1869339 RepID=UPI0025F2ED8A|nr:hypothetical protein [Polaromonas sp.]MBI2724624.1 hypothetical protein [Polaromonas sp.]